MTQFEADLEAEKAFQQAEAAKASHSLAISESTSGSNTSRLEANKATKQAEASQDAASSNTSSDDASGEGQKNYIDEQKQAVKRVLKCESNKYYQILEVNDSFTKQKIKKV